MTDDLRVEVLMEDRTWRPGTVLDMRHVKPRGIGALIEMDDGITAWFYRQQGPGRPNEWRYVDG